nr:MAG TPA: hypothetical protein [Caudoviricetes sp.]
MPNLANLSYYFFRIVFHLLLEETYLQENFSLTIVM